MAITVECGCGKRFGVRDEIAGKTIRCPACREPVDIPTPAMTAIIVDDEPLASAIKPKSPVTSAFEKSVAMGGKILDGIAEAYKIPPDTRTLDARRHDELIDAIKGVQFRLTWLIILTVVFTVGSCAATTSYIERSGRVDRSRF